MSQMQMSFLTKMFYDIFKNQNVSASLFLDNIVYCIENTSWSLFTHAFDTVYMCSYAS